MYVSADEPLSRYIAVFVDDVLVSACREASEEEGWVRVYVRDKTGRFCLTADRRHVCTEVRHGRVRLRMRESAPLWAAEQFVQRRTARGGEGEPHGR